MESLEAKVADLEARVAILERLRIFQFDAWRDRATPMPGSRIGRDRLSQEWQLYRDDRSESYDMTAVYIGPGMAVMYPSG